MTFFLIVPSVIIISIIAVHGIANYVGLKIKYGTLFLCAALAFVALFVALELSSNPDKFFFLRLGAVILPSAAIVTALNRFLILREKTGDAKFTEEVRREYSKQVESKSPADKKILSEVDKPLADKKISVPEQKTLTSDKLKSADKTKPSTKDIPKTSPVDKTKPSPSEVEPSADKKISKAVQAEHFEQVLKAAQAEKNFDAESLKAEESLADVDKTLADVESSADTETLESLLEYAKAEKAKGNITATIDAYEKALEDYGANDYAPFIAIDLSAIYREQAAYTKAIKVYEEALTLPPVKKNSAVETEFKRKLAYMRTVQAVLLRHKALTTPFSQIPISYMQEVELEFRENTTSENL